MQVTASDLAGFGGSTPFTFPGIANTTHLADPRYLRPAADADPREDPAPPVGGARFDLIRTVVEQILGRALPDTEVDAITARPQPVPVAFDRARQLEAVARAEAARAEQVRQIRAAATDGVAWSATLELHEATSGGEAFAVSGALRTPDGHEVELEVRIVGDGTSAVLPLRLEVDLGPDGRPVRAAFTGRAVDATPDAGAAASGAAWAGLPVRVHGADGSLHVTTLETARAAVLGAGGGAHVDLVA